MAWQAWVDTTMTTATSTVFVPPKPTMGNIIQIGGEMRFYWVRDRVRQGQYLIYWKKGRHNKADYYTKHHPSSHHQAIRPSVLHMNDRSKNYFECLQEQEDNEESNERNAAHSLTTDEQSDCGEGVLIPITDIRD